MILQNNIRGEPMDESVGCFMVGALCVCELLYLLWKLAVDYDRMIRRREAKRREDAEGISICRWGFDANGEMYRVRVRLPRQD